MSFRKCAFGVSVLLIWLILGACDGKTVYKSHEEIADAQWFADVKPRFVVKIEDTTARYNVYYLLRNAVQYPYYNLYLTRKITGPGNQILSHDLVELKISDEVTGKPYGKGLGDLFDQKILFLKNHSFAASGKYTFEISQSMRQNPLPFIMSIGICVEKAE